MGMFLYAFEDRNMYAFLIVFDSTDIESPFGDFDVKKKKRPWMRRWPSSKAMFYSNLG